MSQKLEIDSGFRATIKTINHCYQSLRPSVYFRSISVCFQRTVFLGGFSALDVRWDSFGVIHPRWNLILSLVRQIWIYKDKHIPEKLVVILIIVVRKQVVD